MSQGLKISSVIIIVVLIIGAIIWSRQNPLPVVQSDTATTTGTTTSEMFYAPSTSTDTSDAGLDQDMISVDSQIEAIVTDDAAAGDSL